MQQYRYFIHLAYNGAGFHGWQIQPNAVSIQSVLENALGIMLGNRISLTGAGRTDTGVHARNFFAHFDYPELMNVSEREQLTYRLNKYLGLSISIIGLFRVIPGAHARFSAISRTYCYYISRKKDPFLQGQSWYYSAELDLVRMQEAAAILMEYSDFGCFSKSNTQNKTNRCVISESFIHTDDLHLVYTVTADRFLRNMVRAIVGTLIEVGKMNLTIQGFRNLVETGTRSDAGMSVPACGLFLEQILYPPEIRVLSEN